MPRVTGLGHVGFYVRDLERMVAFYRDVMGMQVTKQNYRIETVVNHASAIGCYFFDPEGNRTEVFWVTGRPSWVPVANPIDIERPDADVLAEVDRLWDRVRHVPVGGTMSDEPETLQIGR